MIDPQTAKNRWRFLGVLLICDVGSATDTIKIKADDYIEIIVCSPLFHINCSQKE